MGWGSGRVQEFEAHLICFPKTVTTQTVMRMVEAKVTRKRLTLSARTCRITIRSRSSYMMLPAPWDDQGQGQGQACCTLQGDSVSGRGGEGRWKG